MAVFDSKQAKVLMPRTIADGMITKTQSTSTVAKLSASEPQKFGEVDYIIFDDFPRAEFVEEGADKGSTSGGFRSVTAKPHKAQVTMRFNEEVQWMDEDNQLGILDQLGAKGSEALSRALDLGLYHRINPLSGAVITGWDNYLTSTTNVVTDDDEFDQVIREAVGLLVNRDDDPITPTGLALAPDAVWDLANLQGKLANGDPSGQQRYPNLGLGANIESFLGLNAASGSTVSGKPEAAKPTGVRGIVGDYTNGIRWGIQRDLPIELIRFGDPDGGGDLKRKNQIALRLELVYGWYVFADRFAVIKAAGADEGGDAGE
ncbi:phage major capsid protein [Brevibacterium sp. 91QC2O2]|uniref:phage major capsid family protein n=1 Tax=Brevibacterium TaxID=1696 RepID=UPI00211C2E66|nr:MULTISPECIES: phage major capsid protein [unclassified Brevibacterium]MCQ9367344.1 phage major capsid protein [Brevibacterium sp. 91QC2O2]MCQ9384643.1 phage major capsid protein [Brevibacterium sp. 68QC2CO]